VLLLCWLHLCTYNLEEIINFPEYQMKNLVKVSELKKLLIINGIAANDEKYKVYRFAQMYKYWLGLSSRKEDSLRIGQKMKNKIVYLDYNKKFGKISTGYKSPDIFFHMSKYDGDFNRLLIDDMVEFSIGENEKGFIAINVKKTNN